MCCSFSFLYTVFISTELFAQTWLLLEVKFRNDLLYLLLIRQIFYVLVASFELPFHKVKDELNTNVESDANYTNKHLEKLDELKKYESICHLNIQSMSYTFDEFQFMINQTNFDVIALSETWLKNDKHLLKYVRPPGYEFANRNRDKKRSGGVGIYIRDR